MLEWDDLRSFLAIARHGSLSAAARALKVTQTTMGRRLEGLHSRTGARLLQRTPTGYELTAAGERVLNSVERMEAEALSVELAISGEDIRLEGQIRITTVETFGARVLVPMLKSLQASHPNLEIELITDTRALSLSRREADIAIRLAEFEQHDVVVSRVGDMRFALYASRDYLKARGIPDFSKGALGHSLIALQDDLALLPEAKRLASAAHAATIAIRTNSRDAQLQAAIAGYGIVMLPCYLAREEPSLVELSDNQDRLVRGLWLGVHRDVRHSPRIKLAMSHIADGLRSVAGTLNPD